MVTVVPPSVPNSAGANEVTAGSGVGTEVGALVGRLEGKEVG